jgi:transcriptional regulator with XRE-family HTH domain
MMTNLLKDQLGKRIKAIRKAMKLSQKEFAQSLDTSNTILSNVELGISWPSPGIIFNMALKFNINLDFLFLGNGDLFQDKRKTKSNDYVFNKDMESIDDIVALAKNSPLFRFAVIGYSVQYCYQNEEILKRNIEENKITRGETK